MRQSEIWAVLATALWLPTAVSAEAPASEEVASAQDVGAVEEFAGGVAQFDDMTCLALRMNSNKPA